ncbi:10232_t:CDS:2 [Funneliformis caledonium]|uniref:10232_t:CDS:1 n=1 Tax=Funneliformis caledonium TaxID=1117310 RepID=A0A9N9FJF5_9GLOM|nr:10232_t:CDS:2 [Funneliformis caledonium]
MEFGITALQVRALRIFVRLVTINSEFEKVANKASLKALKTSVNVISKNGSRKDSLEELFPKVDVSIQFTSKIMALATAMEKSFDRYIKILVAPIIAVLTNKIETVCDSAIGTLDALVNACGFNPLIGSFSTSLATDNPLLRKDLLNWLSEYTAKTSPLNEASIRNNPLARNFPSARSCLPTRSSPIPEIPGHIEIMSNALDPISLALSHIPMTLKFTTSIGSACSLDLDEEMNTCYIHCGLANIAIEEEEKDKESANLFPQNSNNYDNMEDNIDEQCKIKLLRLQQMFGYPVEQTINE